MKVHKFPTQRTTYSSLRARYGETNLGEAPKNEDGGAGKAGWVDGFFNALPEILEAGGSATGDVIDAAQNRPDAQTGGNTPVVQLPAPPAQQQEQKQEEAASMLSSAAMPMVVVGIILVAAIVIGLVVVMRS